MATMVPSGKPLQPVMEMHVPVREHLLSSIQLGRRNAFQIAVKWLDIDPGDLFLALDNIDVRQLTPLQIIDLLKAKPENSLAKLLILKCGQKEVPESIFTNRRVSFAIAKHTIMT